MSVLASGTTKTISVSDVDVTLKKLSYGEQKEAMKLAKTDEMEMMDICILKSVTKWEIKDSDSKILPVDKKSLDLLEASFVNELAQEILKFNNMGPELEKNLDAPSKQA